MTRQPVMFRPSALMVALAALALWCLSPMSAEAQTRRAFVVGVNAYSDPEIVKLSRAANDASDVADDLQDLGFDKQNVTLLTNVRSRDDFMKSFNDFLKTVQPGDETFFFFSGHGYGVKPNGQNYLLTGGTRGLVSFARTKVSKEDAKSDAVVRVRSKSYRDQYEAEELPRSGITETEIRSMLAERQPAVAVIIMDACRDYLVRGPGDDAGSQLVEHGLSVTRDEDLQPNLFVLYSASPGQQAIEQLPGFDRRRNSLFTDILRNALFRPGFDIRQIASQVSSQVKAVAAGAYIQQVPVAVHNLKSDYRLIASVGAERNELKFQPCDFAKEDWDRVKANPSRSAIENHLARFAECGFAKDAKEMLADVGAGAADSADRSTALDGDRRQLQDTSDASSCDKLAGSDQDPARPTRIPGVPVAQIGGPNNDTRAVIDACQAAVDRSPRTARFTFNLARALEAHSRNEIQNPNEADRKQIQALSVRRYQDAAKAGYVAAINNLAVLYDNGVGVDRDAKQAVSLWREAAQQGLPIAMYNLAWKYRTGDDAAGIDPNPSQAYEWSARAADAGYVPAMILASDYLRLGRGVEQNAKRGEELLLKAAGLGSRFAKERLIGLYRYGSPVYLPNSSTTVQPKSVEEDDQKAMIWASRAADEQSSVGRYYMARFLEDGTGLPIPQQALAERYWRLAANSGDPLAQFEYVKRIEDHRLIVRPEDIRGEAEALLQRAVAGGSSRAALLLAQLYRRNNTVGIEVDRAKAVAYAFKAISIVASENPRDLDYDPLTEIKAGHLLVEMARGSEIGDQNGQAAIRAEEVERLEKYYGQYDPQSHAVRVNRLDVPDVCRFDADVAKPRELWVWDWGRRIAPTEIQFRADQLKADPCYADVYRTFRMTAVKGKRARKTTAASLNAPTSEMLRSAFADVYQQSRTTKTAFADMLSSRIVSAKDAQKPTGGRSR